MNTLPFLQLCKPSLQPPLQLTAYSRMILSLANRFYPFSMKTLKYTNTIKRYRNIAKADGLTRDVPYFIHVMHRNTEYNRRDSNAEYDSSRCSVWPEYNGRDLNGKFDFFISLTSKLSQFLQLMGLMKNDIKKAAVSKN